MVKGQGTSSQAHDGFYARSYVFSIEAYMYNGRRNSADKHLSAHMYDEIIDLEKRSS